MILFLRTSEIGIDSRLLRFCGALEKAGIAHAAAYWDRSERPNAAPVPSIRYAAPLGYASRRATALRLIRVNLFFMATLWRRRRSVGLVHAVDLDSALAAWIMHRLLRLPFIYDVYDHYADSRGLPPFARRLLDRVERRIFRDASLVILADRARVAQHGPIPADKLLVVENVPSIDRDALPQGTQPMSDRLRIGYLGTFEGKHRGLEDLIAVVEADPRLELEIAGAGAIVDQIAAAAARCPRIILHPPLDHVAGLTMLAGCDIVAGLYYIDVPNHRHAAPNKYYEHLLLGRPLLTSAQTPPGAKVAEHDTGWVVADGREGIVDALAQALADPDATRRKGANAAALWQTRYADYAARIIGGDYVRRARGSSRPVDGTLISCSR